MPDILKEVLTGLDVTYQIQGTFEQREYCVQYRETDFDFASRLMEEEGIYYFFKHTAGGHQMVLANTPQIPLPRYPMLTTAIWEGGSQATAEEDRVFDWSKGQEIRSGKYHRSGTTRSRCPTSIWMPTRPIMDTVKVGTVSHKLKVAATTIVWRSTITPAGTRSRFDGVDKSGGDQAT